jgi:hypothetical protein
MPRLGLRVRKQGRESKMFTQAAPHRAIRLFVIASMVATALLIPLGQAAGHVAGVRLSASGTAVIDGLQSPGEWTAAAHIDFQLNLPAGGTTPATLFEMNDSTTLYLAVLVPGPYVGRGGIAFEFDNDHDGVREAGDDIANLNGSETGTFESLLDGYRDPCGEPTPACGFADTQGGGTTDVQAALMSDASGTFYEYAVLLDTADNAHDFSLHPGDTVGFTIWATFLGPYPLFAHTFFPAIFPNNAGEYGDIVIASQDSTPPVITANRSPGPNGTGWNNESVIVTWAVNDPETGISASAGCEPTTLSQETGGTTLTCNATNGAGMTSSASVTLKIDRSAPQVVFSGNAGVYTVDQTVAISCSAQDVAADPSGVASGISSSTCPTVNAPAYSLSLGSHTLTGSATDNADNSTTTSTSFTVIVTYQSLCTLGRSFEAKAQTADVMCGLLRLAQIADASNKTAAKAGIIHAYSSLVRSQSGRTLTQDQAAILERLVVGL